MRATGRRLLPDRRGLRSPEFPAEQGRDRPHAGRHQRPRRWRHPARLRRDDQGPLIPPRPRPRTCPRAGRPGTSDLLVVVDDPMPDHVWKECHTDNNRPPATASATCSSEPTPANRARMPDGGTWCPAHLSGSPDASSLSMICVIASAARSKRWGTAAVGATQDITRSLILNDAMQPRLHEEKPLAGSIQPPNHGSRRREACCAFFAAVRRRVLDRADGSL